MWPFKTKERRSPKSYEAYVMCDDTRGRQRLICIGSRLELPLDYPLEAFRSQTTHRMAEPGHWLAAGCPACDTSVRLMSNKLQLHVHGIDVREYRSLRNFENQLETLLGRS